MEKSLKIILASIIIVLVAVNLALFYSNKKTEESPEVPVLEEPKEIIEDEPQVIDVGIVIGAESEENIIQVTPDGFDPKEMTILVGEEITWENNGASSFMIACYKNGARSFLGERISDADEISAYKFESRGEYNCIDSIYGLRGKVFVNPKNIGVGNAVSLMDRLSMNIENLLAVLLFAGFILATLAYFSKKK